jgi:hypothetical protein
MEFQVDGFELEVTFHPGPQGRQTQQAAHELDLVENGLEEELTEGRQSGIRKVVGDLFEAGYLLRPNGAHHASPGQRPESSGR